VDETERAEVVQALADELERRGVPDAEMFRRVAWMRSALKDIDRELAALERYFTLALPVQIPPS
jgi:hypothetical protein